MHAYSPRRLRNAIKKHFPNCPPYHAEFVFERVMMHAWPGLAIEHAVGVTVQNYIRHNLTDYDHLLNMYSLTRKEARLCVKEEVEEVFAAWTGGSRYPPPLPKQWRRRYSGVAACAQSDTGVASDIDSSPLAPEERSA